MHCPFCQHIDTRVIDSRVSDDGATIRRRRVCEACGERFSTLETIELKLPLIIKSDARREAFDARKLRVGFDRALQKRPVSEEQIEAAVRAVVHQLRMTAERKVFVIEANPNPDLSYGEDFAASAEHAGVGYAELVQKVLNVGRSYRPAWKERA